MRTCLPLVAMLLLAACRTGPTIVPGPAVQPTFAPPAGLVQQERYRQRRNAAVEFSEGDTQLVRDDVAGVSEERYEPLAGGGFRVTSVLVDEVAARNGLRIKPEASLAGISFTHLVDGAGRFVRSEGLDESIAEILGRLGDANARDAARALLTPAALEDRLRRAWKARFAHVCGEALSPGDSFVVVDEQEIPVAGAARGVVRQLVTGTRDVLALRLSLGGRGSPDVDEAQALGLLEQLPGGLAGLTETLRGEGERYVSVTSCQTTRERMALSGEVRLNPEAASPTALARFPTRITFEVEREVWRGPPGAPPPPKP